MTALKSVINSFMSEGSLYLQRVTISSLKKTLQEVIVPGLWDRRSFPIARSTLKARTQFDLEFLPPVQMLQHLGRVKMSA